MLQQGILSAIGSHLPWVTVGHLFVILAPREQSQPCQNHLRQLLHLKAGRYLDKLTLKKIGKSGEIPNSTTQ